MELKIMTNTNLIFLDAEWASKEEVLTHLVDALDAGGVLASRDEFLKAVLLREEISATGLESGLAIPHGKSTAVKKAAFAVARLKNPISTWESLDPNNQVQLVFLLAIPEAEAGTTHLKLLSELSIRLMDEQFRNRLMQAKNSETFLDTLAADIESTEAADTAAGSKKILAITACASGIAHTYMAAEALEKAGRELGIEVIVEKQGANGIENGHTADRIKDADAVIFATDIAPKNTERFNGLPFVQTRVAEPLKNAKGIIQKALNNPDGTVHASTANQEADKDSKQGIWAEMSQAVLTGISYMIPVIVSAGLMIGIAKLGAMPFGLVQDISAAKYAADPNKLLVILHFLDAFGSMIFKFMYPVFGAFVAYAIANRPGLVAGFIGGAFATGMHYTFWGIKDGVPSGFLGALFLGLAAGYIAKFLNEKVKVSKNLQAIKPMLIIPGVSVLVIFFLNFYIVDPVFGALNVTLRNLIQQSQQAGALTLSAIIAAATAFDLGGPINKAAGAIAIGLAADKIFPLTPRVLAIVIPPIGLGLATILDKYVVGRRVFDEDLRLTGNTSLILGLIAISEGAIPFMLRNPLLTIPINIIGAILGSVVAVALGAVQWYPLPAVWGWPLVEHLWAYLVGLAAGALFIALANIFIRNALLKRKEKQAK